MSELAEAATNYLTAEREEYVPPLAGIGLPG
jgi:hypothetical protein